MLDSLRSRPVVPTVSLSDDVPGAEGLTYEDALAYTDAVPVDVQAERAELLRKVVMAVEGLPHRHREVILRRAADEHLEGIGDSLGLSAERIRQIEAEALSTVRRQVGYNESPCAGKLRR
jgi:DNA-directed RNA polymerase sigma subunit (sigma70/sigma32)